MKEEAGSHLSSLVSHVRVCWDLFLSLTSLSYFPHRAAVGVLLGAQLLNGSLFFLPALTSGVEIRTG